MLGDLNARTGTLNDFIERDCQDFLVIPDTYNLDKNWPKRNNADYTVNKLGGEILQLCIANKLRILNGRVTGDLDGKLTSYQSTGASTVDYGIARAISEREGDFRSYPWDILISNYLFLETAIRLPVDSFP